MTQHYAAIHAIKNKLQLSEDDYRALLQQLTGKRSLKQLSVRQLNQVRDHMSDLAVRMGIPQPTRSSEWRKRYAKASPMERKVHAMWNDLVRRGVIRDDRARALRAWVKRQTGLDDLAFADWAQLSDLIEALKDWQDREGIPPW